MRFYSGTFGLPAVYRAMTHAMWVQSGLEAVELLLDSVRVIEDVTDRLNRVSL